MNLDKLEEIVSRSLKPRCKLNVEVTTTQQCNCRCKYCFESEMLNQCQNASRDLVEEHRQLELISSFCRDFDLAANESLGITFWGGEPLINIEFIKQIIHATIDYDFVHYYVFTNGTLSEQIQSLLVEFKDKHIKRKIHFQLSYDGEPHNQLMRGPLSSSRVLETARLLKSLEIPFSFKATLSFSMVQHLPEIWRSYRDLFEEFGMNARYSPTLDMCESEPTQDDLSAWWRSLLEIAKLEKKFIDKFGFPLMKCFDYGSRRVCDPSKTVMMHNDGNFYVCHGAVYLQHHAQLCIGRTAEVSSLGEVFAKMKSIVDLDHENVDCHACSAVWCTSCHINYVDPTKLHADWIQCASKPKARCWCMKLFGLVARALSLSSMKLGAEISQPTTQ